MINKVKMCQTNRIAVFLALFYAFTTRSILGPIIYRGIILWVYYGVLYACLLVCFWRRFMRDGQHLYVPKYFFSIILLFLVILFGLFRTGDLGNLLHYGIALMLPFAMKPEMKANKTIGVVFVIIGIILFIGCLINFLFPIAYNRVILPLFSESVQKSLHWQTELGIYFFGFTTQVGYTSFFLSVAMGGLFCFRKNVFKGWFIPLSILLAFGMLLTGKRGPVVFLLIGVLFIYFYESHGKERFVRVFQIALIIVAAYVVLFFLSTYTNNAGITRIFESIQQLVLTRDIKETGREQLRNQAIRYFRSHILTGIGWTNFKNFFSLRNTHVHNIYFQLLCETGIIGSFIFMTFFAKQLLQTLNKLKQVKSNGYEYSWLLLSLFIQIYFLLYGITGNPLYDVEEIILYFFAVGVSNLSLLSEIEVNNEENVNNAYSYTDFSIRS